MGPFTYWPTSYGFEHFYGFLAGETSQWEPRLVENTSAIEPPHDEKYHLTEDMAANPKAPENKHVQYFDNNDSDGIYQDGWYACTFGPLTPWVNAQPGLADWDSSKDVWELYDLTKDFSQMHDLAQEQPKKLAEMKKLFLAQAKENKVFPIGAGIWLRNRRASANCSTTRSIWRSG